MRTETEIAEKFERLNSLAKNCQEQKITVDIGSFIAYTHAMSALLWVLGEQDNTAIEPILESSLANLKSSEKAKE